GEVLFIDARSFGQMETRRLRALSDHDISRIASTYHAWRSDAPATTYRDVDGFCHVASREEIAAQGYVLAPSRYVGSDDEVADPNTPESIAERTNLAVQARRLLSEFDSAR